MPTETKKPCTAATVQGKNESNQIQNNCTALGAKKQEIFALRNQLTDAEIAINKAFEIMQGLYDHYLSESSCANLFSLCQDRIMLQAEIVMDYLFLAQKEIAQAAESSSSERQREAGEGESHGGTADVCEKCCVQ